MQFTGFGFYFSACGRDGLDEETAVRKHQLKIRIVLGRVTIELMVSESG